MKKSTTVINIYVDWKLWSVQIQPLPLTATNANITTCQVQVPLTKSFKYIYRKPKLNSTKALQPVWKGR